MHPSIAMDITQHSIANLMEHFENFFFCDFFFFKLDCMVPRHNFEDDRVVLQVKVRHTCLRQNHLQ